MLVAAHRITTPPVPVRAIARREGFEIVENNRLRSLKGRLVGTTIELAPTTPEVVHRFTIAHELGHAKLDTDESTGPGAEVEANAFAGELLVPGPLLQRAIAQTKDLSELARRFAVSRSVMRIAAENHRVSGLAG
jgi:hypothetical protein